MKWFCYIFSIYLVVLSCMPCSDGDHLHTQQNSGNAPIYLTAANSSPEHHNCTDTCSPICGCHCCSVSFTIRSVEAFSFPMDVVLVKKAVFPNLYLHIKDVALTIDHPPKLA